MQAEPRQLRAEEAESQAAQAPLLERQVPQVELQEPQVSQTQAAVQLQDAVPEAVWREHQPRPAAQLAQRVSRLAAPLPGAEVLRVPGDAPVAQPQLLSSA